MIQTAKELAASGVATLPVDPVTKVPRLRSWRHLVLGPAEEREMEQWFAGNGVSIAIVAGDVQCIDIDEKHGEGIMAAYAKAAEASGLDYVLGSTLHQKTPSGGYHLIFRCAGELRNIKLASNARRETLFETRGLGGYFLVAPSAGYRLLNGSLQAIPSLSIDDRDALLDLARTFDQTPIDEHWQPAAARDAARIPGGTSPGDEYDNVADVPALLRRHGWTELQSKPGHWRRPGKTRGESATWDHVPGRFFVFSTSTEFEPRHPYRPWHLYALLECGGDYAAAARELRRQGFGATRPGKPARPLPPPDPHDPGPEVEEPYPPEEDDEDAAIARLCGVPTAKPAETRETAEEMLLRTMAALQWDQAIEPGPLRVLYTVSGVIVGTPGNISTIAAPVKTGKSAFSGAALAAALDAAAERDCLGWRAENVEGKAVLYLDTEQSPDDFWHTCARIRRRAGLDTAPPNFVAYHTVTLDAKTAWAGLQVAAAHAAKEFGGLHSIVIDGVADLVVDVNDPMECNAFLAELHRLAVRLDCHIACVIHLNPGSEKLRGHLGSQLERRAESNLLLEKDGEITLVWSEKQRRSPISKDKGPRFAWDDRLQMHLSVEGAKQEKVTKKVMEWADLLRIVFHGETEGMLPATLTAKIMETEGIVERSAKRVIQRMRVERLLILHGKNYYPAEDLPVRNYEDEEAKKYLPRIPNFTQNGMGNTTQQEKEQEDLL